MYPDFVIRDTEQRSRNVGIYFCSSFAVLFRLLFAKNLAINGFADTEMGAISKDFFSIKNDLLFPEINWDIYYSEWDRTIEMVGYCQTLSFIIIWRIAINISIKILF